MKRSSDDRQEGAQPSAIPMDAQAHFWNEWNTETREKVVGPPSLRQAECFEGWLRESGRNDLEILDAGCGTGWLSQRLLKYGRVTGTDLAD
jgi:2-polyprenyl-3-methyl-5-hydroxy-6-metoxy-1,4-benzoquinol methylase